MPVSRLTTHFGKNYLEQGTLSRFRVGGHKTAVVLRYPLDDRQSHPGALVPVLAVQSDEYIEDAFRMDIVKTYTVIGHAYEHIILTGQRPIIVDR